MSRVYIDASRTHPKIVQNTSPGGLTVRCWPWRGESPTTAPTSTEGSRLLHQGGLLGIRTDHWIEVDEGGVAMITDEDRVLEVDPAQSPQLLLSRTATNYVELDADIASVTLEAGGPVLVLDGEDATLLEQRVPYLLPANRKARLHMVDAARVTLTYKADESSKERAIG